MNTHTFIILLIFIKTLFAGDVTIDMLKHQLIKTDGQEKVDVLNTLSELYIPESSEKAVDYCEQASELAKSLKYKQGEASAVFIHAKIYRHSDEYEQALKHLQSALIIFQEIKNDSLIAQSLIEIGLNYFMISNIEQALENFNKALNISRQLNDSSAISITYYNLGRCYRKTGKLDEALTNAFNSLEYEGKNNHYALNTISIVYGMMGNLEKSLDYQEQALKIRQELGLTYEIITSLYNMGLILNLMNKPVQAMEYNFKALKIAEEINDKTQLSRVLNNIGFGYDEYLKEPEKAIHYYERSLKISKEINADFEVANTMINIGIVQSKAGKNENALMNLESGLQLARDIKSNEFIKEAYIAISRHYERENNYQFAFENYKSFIAVKDSIFSKQSSDRIAEMQVKYETEKTDKENEIYRLHIEREKFKKTRLYFGLIVFIILIIILFFLYMLKNKTNKKLNKEISERKKIEAELEIRVRDRTKKLDDRNRELKKLKDELEQKVAEKTKELRKKVFDLERFQDAIIDRELRMKELQDRIDELENESGNKF